MEVTTMKFEKRICEMLEGVDTPETLKVFVANKGIHLDDDESEALLQQLSKAEKYQESAEALADDELENVAGGGCGGGGSSKPDYSSYIGKRCEVQRYNPIETKYGTIIGATPELVCGEYMPEFKVQLDDGEVVFQDFQTYGFRIIK